MRGKSSGRNEFAIVMVQKKEQGLGFSHLKTIQQPRRVVAMVADAGRENVEEEDERMNAVGLKIGPARVIWATKVFGIVVHPPPSVLNMQMLRKFLLTPYQF